MTPSPVKGEGPHGIKEAGLYAASEASSHLHDFVRLAHRAIVRLRTLLDLIDDVHARGHLADDRILAVKEGGVVEADEELRIRRIRVL